MKENDRAALNEDEDEEGAEDRGEGGVEEEGDEEKLPSTTTATATVTATVTSVTDHHESTQEQLHAKHREAALKTMQSNLGMNFLLSCSS